MAKELGYAVTLYDQWEAEFKPLLGSTARWEGFRYIVRDQLERQWPEIIETGTLRRPGNWAGDGQSTKIWDWVISKKTGFAVSVDASRHACETAKLECPHVKVVNEDSVSFLRGITTWVPNASLLYLDSYDYAPGQELNASMHQLAELAAVWAYLPSGCLVASDDSHNADQGKPVLTRRLLHMLGIEPILDSYIVVWRKP